MEPFRKYAFLPDVDDSPDVFETIPSPAPSISPRPRSSSRGSTHSDRSEQGKSGVVRRKIQPGKARGIFGYNRVNATNVDFSDRIAVRRESYRVRNGKARQHEASIMDGQPESSDDEPETVDVKIARLLREVEEVKAAITDTANPHANDVDETERPNRYAYNSMLELTTVLQNIQLRRHLWPDKFSSTSLDIPTMDPSVLHRDSLNEGDASLKNVTLSQEQNARDRMLTEAIALESRLSVLENILGPRHDLMVLNDRSGASANVFSLLSELEAQFATLSATTGPSLESLSTQVAQLIDGAVRLEETRNAATRAAHEAIKARSLGIKPTTSGGSTSGSAVAVAPENLELVEKVDALYSNLPIIEAIIPLLPGIIERLRTLRVLHADVALAEARLVDVEQRQSRTSSELGAWREGLEKVEAIVARNGGVVKSNMEAVEGWVKELEKRMDFFGASHQ